MHRMNRICSTKAAPVIFLLELTINSVSAQQVSAPPLLTFNELVALYETDPPSPELSDKLARLLTTPFVNNSAGVRPPRGISPDTLSQPGFLRVATLDIRPGLEFDAIKAALTNDRRFFRRLPRSLRGSKYNLSEVMAQVEELSRADVIVLNEVDYGLKR